MNRRELFFRLMAVAIVGPTLKKFARHPIATFRKNRRSFEINKYMKSQTWDWEKIFPKDQNSHVKIFSYKGK